MSLPCDTLLKGPERRNELLGYPYPKYFSLPDISDYLALGSGPKTRVRTASTRNERNRATTTGYSPVKSSQPVSGFHEAILALCFSIHLIVLATLGSVPANRQTTPALRSNRLTDLKPTPTLRVARHNRWHSSPPSVVLVTTSRAKDDLLVFGTHTGRCRESTCLILSRQESVPNVYRRSVDQARSRSRPPHLPPHLEGSLPTRRFCAADSALTEAQTTSRRWQRSARWSDKLEPLPQLTHAQKLLSNSPTRPVR